MDPQKRRREALQKELGELRMGEALKAIEAAQRQLGKAGEALCPIVGGVKAWQKSSKLYDAVNAYWHEVNLLAEKMRRQPAGIRVDENHADYEDRKMQPAQFSPAQEHSHGG